VDGSHDSVSKPNRKLNPTPQTEPYWGEILKSQREASNKELDILHSTGYFTMKIFTQKKF
jgi:hypothetical protein